MGNNTLNPDLELLNWTYEKQYGHAMGRKKYIFWYERAVIFSFDQNSSISS